MKHAIDTYCLLAIGMYRLGTFKNNLFQLFIFIFYEQFLNDHLKYYDRQCGMVFKTKFGLSSHIRVHQKTKHESHYYCLEN